MDLRDDAVAVTRSGSEDGTSGETISPVTESDSRQDGKPAESGRPAETQDKEDPLLLADLELKGRLLREDRSEHACTAIEVSPRHVKLTCKELPEAGERIVVYLEEIGRLEGHVAGVDEEEGSFALVLILTRARSEKVRGALEWLRDKRDGRARERRRHLRIEPTDGQSHVTLADGRRYPCEVLDISLSGASIRMDVLPAVGTYVTLGRMRGRVVRHHEHGIAIEFVRVADTESLRQTVRTL